MNNVFVRTALALLLIPSFWTIPVYGGEWVKVGAGHEMFGLLFGWTQAYAAGAGARHTTLHEDTPHLDAAQCEFETAGESVASGKYKFHITYNSDGAGALRWAAVRGADFLACKYRLMASVISIGTRRG